MFLFEQIWGAVEQIFQTYLEHISKLSKNQNIAIGFAKWTDFYPINSSETIFSISVNFDEEKAEITSNNKNTDNFLFNYKNAKDRVQKINHLFKK